MFVINAEIPLLVFRGEIERYYNIASLVDPSLSLSLSLSLSVCVRERDKS